MVDQGPGSIVTDLLVKSHDGPHSVGPKHIKEGRMFK